jgi:hypothetical protein
MQAIRVYTANIFVELKLSCVTWYGEKANSMEIKLK